MNSAPIYHTLVDVILSRFHGITGEDLINPPGIGATQYLMSYDLGTGGLKAGLYRTDGVSVGFEFYPIVLLIENLTGMTSVR